MHKPFLRTQKAIFDELEKEEQVSLNAEMLSSLSHDEYERVQATLREIEKNRGG